MQKIAIISLITLIVLQCTIKAGIVVYYHLNQDFIASTLCENKGNVSMNCNGKCYLNKKIKEHEKQETKLASILKELKDGLSFLPTEIIFFIEPSVFELSSHRTVYLTKVYSSPLADILQPPC